MCRGVRGNRVVCGVYAVHYLRDYMLFCIFGASCVAKHTFVALNMNRCQLPVSAYIGIAFGFLAFHPFNLRAINR
jgi:hypothetical protein